jgi:hypothetical protein
VAPKIAHHATKTIRFIIGISTAEEFGFDDASERLSDEREGSRIYRARFVPLAKR